MVVLHEGLNELNVNLVPVYVPPPVAQLSGVVTDAETGAPLGGVRVTIDGRVTDTWGDGFYSFDNLEPGSYTITFEKAGYETLVR